MSEQEGLDQALKRAIELHQQGELTKAEAGYREVLELDPDQPDALHLLGVLWHQLGDSTAATEQIRKSLAVNPDQPLAYNNLGNVQAQSGALEDAAGSYEQAVVLRPDYPEAHSNLGNVLVQLGRFEDAAQRYRRAIELRPCDATVHVALAALYERLGRTENALEIYRGAIACEADSVAAHRRLGTLLRKLGRLDEARAVYEQWLVFDPDQPEALHMRAACSGEQVPVRASNGYVKAYFDGFAQDFDEVLAELDYRVPDLVAEAVTGHLGERDQASLDILDLGCGTGLCAAGLRPHARHLTGLDLSPEMLLQAGEREAYDELHQGELTAYLEGCSSDYDLIVAADTLVYFGDLGAVFEAAVAALRTPGSLVFTLETLTPDAGGEDYRLNRFGRYAHAQAYVTGELARAGLQPRDIREVTLRTEGGGAVAGMLVVAVKAQG